MSDKPEKGAFLTKVVDTFLRGDVAIMLVGISLMLGVVALFLTPREEEPQIVVPMADVIVSAPGLSASEVDRRVTQRIEKLLYQIDGVEHVYAMSSPGQCAATVRFYVGEDREDSLLKIYSKMNSSLDLIPPGVESWVVKPIEVDDVPIMNMTLWSDRPELYGDHELRRIAEEVYGELQAIPDTNFVKIISGRPRQIRIKLDPRELAARRLSPLQIAHALREHNAMVRVGEAEQRNETFVVEVGPGLEDVHEIEGLVVSTLGGRPVYLREVAKIEDGPAEIESYSWMGFGPSSVYPLEPSEGSPFDGETSNTPPQVRGERAAPDMFCPAVHISVAKKKGTNAVSVARNVERKMSELAETHLPDGVYWRITRDYGETADAKVDELIESLAIAIITVVALIGVVIGWRAAFVVALAIPVCYSATLFINLLCGYTINRVTLFALILSLGLLVDDPITDVENIARYFAMKVLPPRKAVLKALAEVQPALVMSTLAIIVSFVPLIFITGMMGPYMGPMAVNVPLTVTMSTFVAFMITPWLAMVALRKMNEKRDDDEDIGFDLKKRPLYRISNKVLGFLMDRTWATAAALLVIALLLVGAMAIPAFRVVPLKMLPYDNRNEFQLIVDMPENATLEETDAAVRSLGVALSEVPEVRDFQMYAGVPSAMDFNGMVRHYFMRRGSNVGEIRVNLAPKENRAQQSHTILLRIRNELTGVAEAHDAKLKLVETPPGPPVLSTITAEVYGPDHGSYEELIEEARKVEARMAREPLVVDVDSSIQADRAVWRFRTDRTKAALSGVSSRAVGETLQMAQGGWDVTALHAEDEVDPLWINLRLPLADRSAIDDLESLYVQGIDGQMVQLGAIGEFEMTDASGEPLLDDPTIYRKNLQQVVFVYGEVAGRPPADAIIDMMWDREKKGEVPTPIALDQIRPVEERTWFKPGGGDAWMISDGYEVEWAGEGEWQITLRVFRDLGIAFAAAQIGIFVLLMFQTGSRMLPMVIMVAIPLTLIGVMPGFWLLNVLAAGEVNGYQDPVFLTATAMIGMIALSGIVVRNSVVLIEFIDSGVREGLELREAIIQSVAVRMRPILLTAGTTLLGNWVITLDPIFSGLAWSIMFGILASTMFTIFVVPLAYWTIYKNRHVKEDESA
jgi:multidrug efflux pump subunit AcrB